MLDADEIELESGDLEISLAGDGAINKRTDGVVQLNYDSPAYSGAVVVHQGVLVAGSFQGFSPAPNALGLGETTILPGGTLVHGSADTQGGSFLLNSRLNLAGGDVGLTRTIAASRWDFNGSSRVSAPSRLLLFDPLGYDDIVASVVNFTKRLAMSANLAMLGEGTANLSGGLSLSGDVTLDAQAAAVTIGGTIIAADSGSGALRLRGPGAFTLPNQLGAGSPGPVILDIGAGSTARVAGNTQLTVDNNATLIVNGTLANAEPLIIKNGKLAGSGIVGNVNNQSGEVSPGNSIGVLTTGSYNQGPGGLLTMELLAGPPNTSDLIRANSATLAGTLHAVLASGGDKGVGTTFNLVIANTISISSLQLTTSGFDGFHPRLFVNQIVSGPDVGKQVLQLMLVPEPAGASLALIAAAALTALLRRRFAQV
jgi:autotransporter-associated beta strand protein